MTLEVFNETNEEKKDAAWGDTVVTHLRQHMEPLVKSTDYWENMALMLGEQDMANVKALFKDPGSSGASFLAIAVMEKIRNVIISENENAGISINLKSIDPTATNKTQHDKELLANRKVIEVMLSQMQQSIGGPPFSLQNEKDGDGKSLFGGNVEMFDKMGLDDNSMEDLDYYFATYYRLRHEIAAEAPVNFFIKYNELAENIALYVNDILASKRLSAKVYVNEITGAIDYKYLCPASVNFVGGKRRDLNDAIAKNYEENISVGDFIKLVGADFDLKNDLEVLLQAANATNGTTYTGIIRNADTRVYAFETVDPNGAVGTNMHCGSYGTGNVCNYSSFLEMSVGVGYIEWKSINASTQKETQKNSIGNPSIFPAKADRNMTATSMYNLVTRYTETTFKSYYLILGAGTQRLYKYGKLAYQMIEGAEDEYSSFSIVTYREKGKPAVKVAEPFIIMIQKAWAKFEHLVAAAKPPGRAYNYDSLVKIAQNMVPELGEKQGIDMVMKMFFDGSNELYTAPTTEEGKITGGGNQSSFELPHGLSKTALDFKTIIDYAFSMINDQLGISNLRDGGQPDARDGYKLSMQALQYSHNATQYIRSMMMNFLDNIAKRTLSYTQDIIKFRSKNSIPYKFMLQGLGDQVVNDMSLLEVPLHRYGIFVEALNTKFEREEVKQMAGQALANKQIGYEQWLLISDIATPKKAVMILAYETKRKERIAAQQQQQQNQQAMEMQQQADAAKAQMQQAKTAGEIEVENVKGGYMVKVAEIYAHADLAKQSLKDSAKPGEIDSRKNAAIEESQAKANMAQQTAIA